MNSKLSRFTNPKGSGCYTTQNLYVANCGPAIGISFEDIKIVFSTFGEVVGIHAADNSGTRVIVCYSELTAAKAAFETLNGCHCGALGDRILHMRYSILHPPAKVNDNDSLSVSLLSSELAIPGIYLVHDFITSDEEQELLAAVDTKPWKDLSKRRVQHYGYEFLYETRNVDTKQFLGELPPFVSPIIEKISSFQGISDNKGQLIDQLTGWKEVYIYKHRSLARAVSAVKEFVELCTQNESIEAGYYLKAVSDLRVYRLGFKDVQVFLFPKSCNVLLNLIGLHYCLVQLEIAPSEVMEALCRSHVSEREICVRWLKLGRWFYGFRLQDERHCRKISLGELVMGKDDEVIGVLNRGAVHEVIRVHITQVNPETAASNSVTDGDY